MHNTLKKIRRDQDLTQSELADMIGVSRSCVANWEAGLRKPDIFIIRKYNELFGYKEEISEAFKKISEANLYSLDLTIFNDEGKTELLKKYIELKKNPKYLKKP